MPCLSSAIWVKVDSSGPVFYRPERGGRDGKPFRIFKFRSMVVNADKIGGPSTSGSDPRVTRSGRFIRKLKLDELSQLINVLLGDMSLVGPRPEIVSKVQLYSEEEKKTLKLRPGITDWASIWNSDEGGVLEDAPDPDAVYEEVIRPTKMKLQLYYCESRSPGAISRSFYLLCASFAKVDSQGVEGYPSFDDLRIEALKVIQRQQRELTGSEDAPNNLGVFMTRSTTRNVPFFNYPQVFLNTSRTSSNRRDVDAAPLFSRRTWRSLKRIWAV